MRPCAWTLTLIVYFNQCILSGHYRHSPMKIDRLLIPLSILTMISSLVWIFEIGGTEHQQSLLMCGNFIFVILLTWKIGRLSPFFLFLCTFCFLFIGGHFWGNLINPKFSLRVGTFMDPIPSSEIEWKKTLAYLVLFIYFSFYGYSAYRYKHKASTNNFVYFSDNSYKCKALNKTLYILFWPLALFVLYGAFQSFMLILRSGYSAIYLSQSENYSGNSFVAVLTTIFFAMAMVYGNKKNRRLYIILLFLQSVIGILGGGRGGFGAFLLFAIWLASTRWNLNLRKIILGGGVAISLLMFMSQMSKRSQDSGVEYNAVTDAVAILIYSQGESLATFEKSREYTYPTIAYVQSFVPGSSFLYANLFNPDLKNYETSFSLYLSHCMNFKMFLEGSGGGWTLTSDLYLFSGRTWLGYILLSLLFGYLMAMLECKSKTNLFYRVVLFALFLRLLMLPRTGFNYIFPLIGYVIIYYSLFSIIFKLNRK